MKVFEKITTDNFVLYAAKHYQNNQCYDIDEFYEDLNRIKYLKKLINRFLNEDDEKCFRLILNHVIIIYNVFEMNAATKMIRYKMTQEQMEVLKPILILLKYITDRDMIEVSLNKKAIEYCRKI